MTSSFTLKNSSGTTAAAQSDLESATSLTKYVTTSKQQYHPGSCKAWARYEQVGTQSIYQSYNVTSISDGGTGVSGFTFTTNFSDANYTVIASCNLDSGATSRYTSTTPYSTKSTSSCSVENAVDCQHGSIMFFGDQ